MYELLCAGKSNFFLKDALKERSMWISWQKHDALLHDFALLNDSAGKLRQITYK